MNEPINHRALLEDVAREAMSERDLYPDIPRQVEQEVAALRPIDVDAADAREMRELAWMSIDNDDSRDIDQLSYAERDADGAIRVFVAVANVDSLVHKGQPTDEFAQANTTSVYTPARVFPMLPERLSTDLTSLNADVDRLAIVVEMLIDEQGNKRYEDVYPARVRNVAQTSYNKVAAALGGQPPPELAAREDLLELLRLQDEAAQRMKRRRLARGALEFDRLEPHVVFDGNQVTGLERTAPNRATQLIENFMIGANGVTARFLDRHGSSVIRRVVRSPERWHRIVEVAAQFGTTLPPEPDSRPLRKFLAERRDADPLRFPDLSLTIIKLMGRGEYVVTDAKHKVGHFGLAVNDYTHSTAPNRRYPDLLTQRLLKAIFAKQRAPYSRAELRGLAQHCTDKEDDASKVERRLLKAAGALLLSESIGEEFEAIVTGASDRGTWVRVIEPPVDGKLVKGDRGRHVGERIVVELLRVEPARGFLDFEMKKKGHK